MKGTASQQNYGMRIYDTRLGKFLSVDPIAKDYPELTPYQFASNTPIQAIDWDGLEARYVKTISLDYKIHNTTTIDIKIQNSSKMTEVDVVNKAYAIKARMEESFSGYDKETNTQYKVNVNLIFLDKEKGKIADPKKDFYIDFVDQIHW